MGRPAAGPPLLGDFALPDPPPAKLLLITAGSGINPVMAMLRAMTHRGQVSDVVHIHTAPSAQDVIIHDELQRLDTGESDYGLHLHSTDDRGHLDFNAELDTLVPDWKQRPTWACGPPAMLDDIEGIWTKAGVQDRLHMERFVIAWTDKGGEGAPSPLRCQTRPLTPTEPPHCWKR